MPIYDYKCQKCGNVFEVLQAKDIKTEKCPKCGQTAKKMMSSRVGFIFKGSGFYVNDYKKKSGGENKNEGKTDLKTDTKADTGKESKQGKTGGMQEKKGAKSAN